MSPVRLNKRSEAHWKPIRERRDALLTLTDQFVLPDRGTEDQRLQAADYRRKLRDLTRVTSVNDVVWPTPPSFMLPILTKRDYL